MTDQELLQFNREGLIPGPGESEKSYSIRVEKTKNQFAAGDWIPPSHWDWVRESLNQIFDVKPLYICAFYSDQSLALWQGAATWVEGGQIAAVQLRTGLRKGTYLRIYSREEILAHEAVHGIRCAFNEDRNEEFFAYMTSEQKWRRVLGPILQRPWEVWPFFLSCLGGVFWPICYLGAAVWSAVGFYRLISQHLILRRAGEHLFNILGDARTVRAVLFRLTDQEIDRFSQNDLIVPYIQEQKELRWRLIRLAYFPHLKSV